MKLPKIIPWDAKEARIRSCAVFLKRVPGGTKIQIVYYSSLNFHTIIPYRDLVARNRLAVRAAGDVLRYKTTEEENRGPSVIGELIFDLAITKVSKATD